MVRKACVIIYMIFLSTCFSEYAHADGIAQAGQSHFTTKTIDGAVNAYGLNVRQAPDGGYIIAGISEDYDEGRKACVFKTDAEGNMSWNTKLVPYELYDASAVVLPAGAGFVSCFSTRYNVILTGLGSDGKELASYDGGDAKWIRAVFTDGFVNSSGNCVFLGNAMHRESDYKGSRDLREKFSIMETDEKGIPRMRHSIYLDGIDMEFTPSLCMLADGRMLIAGVHATTGSPFKGWEDVENFMSDLKNTRAYEFEAMKSDLKGNCVWEKHFPAKYGAINAFAVLLKDGNMVICGTGKNDSGRKAICYMGINPEGGLLWQKYIEGRGDYETVGIYPANDGGFIIAGNTDDRGDGGQDIYAARCSADGSIRREKTFGTAGYEYAYGSTQTGAGDIVLCGAAISGEKHIYLVRITQADMQ